MKKYVIALDQGTTSSRAIIFDRAGNIVNIAQKDFTQHFPQPGWVEHNPEAIWSTQLSVMNEALAKIRAHEDDIAAVGITNQRETTMIWDRKSGEPIARAIVWQDRRTARYCDTLKAAHGERIREKTGLMIDAYFSASKIKWLLDNTAGAREKAARGELAFGTVDSWLVFRLTEGKVHVTDPSNASRTMLYNIHTLQWDDELLALFDIPASLLPDVKSSSEIYGYVDSRHIPGGKVPIAGIAGDQQAALFGQMCTQKGMVKTTYGTGCFLLMNTGSDIITSQNNLLTTIAWQIGGKTAYALEGGVFVGGAAIQWVRDGLRAIRTADAINSLAATVPDNGGVYFVPCLAGMGAPHWDQYARGTIIGITRGTTDAHIARATLEGIALQVCDIVKAMEKDTGAPTREFRVDGGASASNLLMQIQADLFGFDIVRPKVPETTALGAAYLAGLAVGFWASADDIAAQWQAERTFHPQLEAEKVAHIRKYWQKAVNAARHWIEE